MDDQVSDSSDYPYTKAQFIDDDGFTELHVTAWTGNTRKLNSLVKKNANVNAQDCENRTPLHLAAVQGNKDIVEALVKAGADVNIKDKRENTPLLKALEVDQKSVAKYLIEKGADVDVVDCEGNSALHKAIIKGSSKIISQIIKRTRDLNVVNKYGKSPLHLAVTYGMIGCVKQLLENGATVDLPDSQRRTPLMIACSTGHSNIARMLLKAGADPYLADKENLTPTAIAEAAGHEDTVTVVAKHALEEKAALSIKENESACSVNIKEDPEVLLQAKSEKEKKDTDSRNEGTNEKKAADRVSDVMSGMNELTSKLDFVRSELKQRLLDEEKQIGEIQGLKCELIKLERERNELLGNGRTVEDSIRSMNNDLRSSRERASKFQIGVTQIEKKLNEEGQSNAKLKDALEKAISREKEAKLEMEKVEKRSDQVKADKQRLEVENSKKDAIINSLKADIQEKEKEQLLWSRRMSVAKSEIASLKLQMSALQNDLQAKQKTIEESTRNYELKIQATTKERNALEKSVTGETRKRSTADRDILAVQQEMTNVTDECNRAKKETKDFQARLEEQSRQHCKTEKSLREQVESLRTDNISLSERVNDLKNSLQQMEQELEKEHVESDRIICGLHHELQRKYAMFRGRTRGAEAYEEENYQATA